MATDYTETSPVVRTTKGDVRGALLTTLYDELYYSFDGIPYAEPPLGELRFRAPREVQPWQGIRDCTEPQAKCLQIPTISQQVEGSEDCLYLNIAVKTLSSEKPLPVMVYLHGGGFRNGEATRRAYGPDYLMREQVIFISIGYRLGPFGFLSFADPKLDIPGNAGLKDIVLALRWIRANVSRFNGDAANVTLFGHSSGSCAVQLLLASPQTEGLFDKAILMAGYYPETNNRPDEEYELAKHLGYEGDNNDSQVFDYINGVDPKRLALTEYRPLYDRMHSSGLAPFLPRVEHYATPGAVLLDEPRVLLRNAWSNRLPIMLGCNSDDGLMSPVLSMDKDPAVLRVCQQRPEYTLPYSLLHNCEPSLCRILGMRILKKFTGAYCSELTLAHYAALEQLFRHTMLHYQQRMIQARLAYSTAETYVYRFDVDSPEFNFYRLRYYGTERRGTVHSDELCYLFRLPASFRLDTSRMEYKVICRWVAMLTEFARSSNPNSPLIQSLVDWQPVTRDEPLRCLKINEELTLITQPEGWKLKFFEQMYRNAKMELI